MPRRWKLLLWVGSLSILADQLTKYWARQSLGDGSRRVIIDGYWEHVLAWNKGVAFSMLSGQRVVLTLVAAVAIGAIVHMVHKAEDHQTGLVTALALMFGGALGNLIDRIRYGEVVDFLHFRLWAGYSWPDFNFADSFIVVGVGILILDLPATEGEERAQPQGSDSPG